VHTKISAENPYGYDRWAFAWEHVPENSAAHLDFGCNNGSFINTLRKKNIARLIGVDVSQQAVAAGRQLFADLEITRIDSTTPLPFGDAAFTSITILDVLEHIYEQTRLLKELNRVLAKGGTLIVTVPGRHLFSFLDMGNLKFRFPRLHKWYYCRRHGREEYEHRYVSNPDGLVGDISAKKRWHEHFSRKKLRTLLADAGFDVMDFDGTGFFHRVLCNPAHILRSIKPIHKILRALGNLDAKLFESANLFCLARKP